MTRRCLILAVVVVSLTARFAFAASPEPNGQSAKTSPSPGIGKPAPVTATGGALPLCPFCLSDGTMTKISGGQLLLVARDGSATPAKDSTYFRQDGVSIVVVGGRIVSQKPGSLPTRQPALNQQDSSKTKVTQNPGSGAKIKGKSRSEIAGSEDEDLEGLEIQR